MNARADRGWWVLLIALLACRFDPAPRPGGVLCGPAGECPGGLSCNRARGLCCAGDDCGRDGGPQPTPMVPDRPSELEVPDAADAAAAETADGRAYEIAPPACDPVQAAGCGNGKTCVHECAGPPGAATAVCKPSAGARKAGESCTREEECASALTCLPVCSGRVCVPRCRADADCGAGSACYSLFCGGMPAAYGYCAPVCDPIVATSGCPSGSVCRLFAHNLRYCGCPERNPAVGGDGAPCQRSSECREGHLCSRWDTPGTCRKICRIGGAAGDCAPGTRCLAMPDQREFGGCVPDAVASPACDPGVSASCPNGGVCEGFCAAAPSAKCSSLPSENLPDGSPCNGAASCRPGSMCVSLRCGDGLAYCRRVCKSDEECTEEGSQCAGPSFQCPTGRVEAPFRTCTFGCDPTGGATSRCPSGTFCRLFEHEIVTCTCNFPAAQPRGADGDACESVACGPGLTCTQESTRRACRPICRVGAPNPCPGGRTCVPLPNQRIYGVCAP